MPGRALCLQMRLHIYGLAVVLFAAAICNAQRIASISTIDATLRYDQNNALDNGTTSTGEISRQTTVLDVFVRPGTNGTEQFRFDINTVSSSGGSSSSECNAPDSGGVCRATNPVTVTFNTSALRHRYELRLRQAIPYAYYHRRFLSCDRFTAESLGSNPSKSCKQDNIADRAECECFRAFAAPELQRFTFAAFDPVTTNLARLQQRSDSFPNDIIQSEFLRNASLYFNAAVVDDDDGQTVYTAPPPTGDADSSTLYVLSHIYNTFQTVPAVVTSSFRSNYIGRFLAPVCYVYDINPIPEQVVHVTVTMTPDDAPSRQQTLTLSTINESGVFGDDGRSTSGSSRNDNNEFGAFTARIENTQSATSSYGPNLGGAIVMCPRANGEGGASTFINTAPFGVATDITVNPWQEAFVDNPAEASGRVFDADTIATLRQETTPSPFQQEGIYYYDAIQTRAVGDDCGQVGVRNKVYAGPHPQIAALVKPNTVVQVEADVIRGNESDSTALPSCFPGFGPSVGANTPLPAKMLAEQRKYRAKYQEAPQSAPIPPHMPPLFNSASPNVYFLNRYMYYEAETTDVEVEVIVTVSGSFLSVVEARADGEIRADASYCHALVDNDTNGVAGELSALVCNTAERRVQDDPNADMESNDASSLDDEQAIDATFSAQFTVQASCAEESGLRVKSAQAGNAPQQRFTSVLEPGRCERVSFNLTLTAEELDPDTGFCTLDLISNSALNNPSAMFLDTLDVGCTLTNNYQRPNTTSEGDIDTQVTQPPAPEIVDAPDDLLDRIAHLFVLAVVVVLPLIMLGLCCCITAYNYAVLQPQVDKYL